MNEDSTTVILGDEYDDAVRNALRVVLLREGAVGVDKSWAIGGSQEIEALQVKFGSSLLTIESETFVGLTISGPKFLVDDIVERVRRELR